MLSDIMVSCHYAEVIKLGVIMLSIDMLECCYAVLHFVGSGHAGSSYAEFCSSESR